MGCVRCLHNSIVKTLLETKMKQGLDKAVAGRSPCLYYRSAGAPGQPVLLLIHGWGGSSRYFQPALQRLGESFHCMAPDLPGFGRTPPLPGGDEAALKQRYSHRGLARCVAEWLDSVGVASEYDVLGHSYGAGVAIALAAMQPQRVRRVVLSNFSTFRDERERKLVVLAHHFMGLLTRLRTWRLAHSDAFARALGARFFHRLPDRAVLREGMEDFWRMDPLAAEWTVRSSLGWETHIDLRMLTQPLLLIHSHHDRIMPPRNAEYTAGLPRNGRLIWLDHCGHLPMVECPERFVEVVRAFLRGSATGE